MQDARRAEVEAMIAKVAAGDRAAFDSLYNATADRLHAVCLSVLKDRPAAEDALQDTYLRVWKSAGRYSANGLSPMTWLMTIARNQSIDRLRARQGRPQAAWDGLTDALPSSAPNPETLAVEADQRRRLTACLDQLDATQAQALRRIYLEGASYADLAEGEAKPASTVRSWLRRGLAKLKGCMGHD